MGKVPKSLLLGRAKLATRTDVIKVPSALGSLLRIRWPALPACSSLAEPPRGERAGSNEKSHGHARNEVGRAGDFSFAEGQRRPARRAPFPREGQATTGRQLTKCLLFAVDKMSTMVRIPQHGTDGYRICGDSGACPA